MEQILAHRFRVTTVQLLWLTGCLLGLGLAHTGLTVTVVWLVSVGLFGCAGLYRRSLLGLIAVVLFGVSLGCWRGAFYMNKLAAFQPYYGHTVTLTVRAQQDGVYGSHAKMTFDGSHVMTADGTKLAGTIAVNGFGASAIFQGDEVQVSGKLRPGYGAKQGTMSFARITVLSHHNTLVAEIRRRFAAGMQSALPEPLSSFSMGLLIGQRATLPDNVKQDLLMVGLTHIIAVSGYNLTIMLHASRKLFAKRSKRLATSFSFVLIALFLLLAGGSASIIRAAIVSTLSIITAYYGRNLKPLNLLAWAAVITAYANPFYLWSDISWYLSFLAFFGVMLLAPLVTERLPFKQRDSVLVSVGIESVCAEIMSLPIVLFIFGQMSYIGLLANVLVVALVPLAMLLATLAGLAGMFLPLVAGWVAWPAKVLLNYMLDTAHVLAAVPHIFVEHLRLPLGEMLAWYGGIAIMITALWFKSRTKSAMITDIDDEYA